MSTPDYCEPLIGWRRWRVSPDGLLLAIVQDTEWPPYAALAAKHVDSYYKDETLCDRDNCPVCGIYAYRTEAHARSQCGPFMQACVIGTVALWGSVVIHKLGYRAQFAYPQSLVYTQGCDGAEIAERYGIPYVEDLSWKSENQNDESWSNPWNPPYQFGVSPFLSYLQRHSLSTWSSQYLCRPEEHKFLVEPPKPKDEYDHELPGLPKGMVAPSIHAPTYFRSPSGLWLRHEDPAEELKWDGSAYPAYVTSLPAPPVTISAPLMSVPFTFTPRYYDVELGSIHVSEIGHIEP